MKDNAKKKYPHRGGPGAIAANPHEGSRSEILADYLFTGWGTVTPVRRQDDTGIDLYCTLTERSAKREVVTDHFVLQTKSWGQPWCFNDRDSVHWLVEYPQPLFLALVDKRAGILRVYPVTERFRLAAFPPLPDRLVLNPEDNDQAKFVARRKGTEFTLPAPILRITLSDFLDEAKMELLRDVFQQWVRVDRENCDLMRHGLLRFRMPTSYKVNEPPSRSIAEMGNAAPALPQIEILRVAEGAECIGGQLARKGDPGSALFAALFVDHLRQTYPDIFAGQGRWTERLPGDLGWIIRNGLNRVVRSRKGDKSRYRGFDAVVEAMRRNQHVAKFIANADAYQYGITLGFSDAQVPSRKSRK